MSGAGVDSANLLRAAMDARGITDNALRAGIAAVVGGESGFQVVTEVSYAHTANVRIRQIFAAAKSMSDSTLDGLKIDDRRFFEAMYGKDSPVGHELGNIQPGDGYLFRGRGLLQLTGRANYSYYGKLIGRQDQLVANPDLANDPETSAQLVVAYVLDRYRGGGFADLKATFGNSFGTVDARKDALYQQYLADGSFNVGATTQPPSPQPPQVSTVEDVQRRLNALGAVPQLQVDGKCGALTCRAILEALLKVGV